MTDQYSISMSELSDRVEVAVKAALEKHAQFNLPGLELSYQPDPGVFGFILGPDQLGDLRASELSAFTADVKANLGNLGGVIDPVALIRKDGATMGFFPRFDMVGLDKIAD